MTKTRAWRWTQKLRLWLRYLLPAFCLAVYRSSVADALPGVTYSTAPNGWRYQEQSAIGQAELLANASPRSVFIGWHMCWHNFVIQKRCTGRSNE